MIAGFDGEAYRIHEASEVMTPALAIYPELVDANIQTTLRLVGGDANRLRPHVKTAKLLSVMRQWAARGVSHFKCSTSLELLTVCEAGAADVLLAYPAVGANARRVRELAEQFPAARISALVESAAQIDAWRGSPVSLFIDVNPGMDRTGVEQEALGEIIRLAEAIQASGQAFRGLHYYDGHLAKYEMAEREGLAHRGYDRLMEIIAALTQAGLKVKEVVTAGTPAFPCTLSYSAFNGATFTHRASPGTVVYCDCTSLSQLPAEYGYRPAAVVISTVVSQPAGRRVTCDAGHKTVSADAGTPTCRVLGREELLPAKPSEEHLPIDVADGASLPEIGETLYLMPMHICPTVNNFDHALIVRGGRVVAVERVTARGRELPLRREAR
ncbi:MAG TPA: D-TA family PLP-dependent enzyme [Blastocatellia bacterium]|nr:D-TA family PLP-dependent enzyme [Blastocatellia bacterium]